MATSSIFAKIVIADSTGADRLVETLEMAEKTPRISCKATAQELTDPDEIRKLFSKQNTICPGKKGREQLRKFAVKSV